jgi:hypothetical protein
MKVWCLSAPPVAASFGPTNSGTTTDIKVARARNSPFRPVDNASYETRIPLLSQGDIFTDVPLAYPVPTQIVEEETSGGVRHFLAGPLEIGRALLITPTCSMRAQGDPGKYAHPVRTLVPTLATDVLLERGLLNEGKLGLIRKYDGLIKYMYLPPHEPSGQRESMALLYMPVTLRYDMIDGQRAIQLAVEGPRQLQRKLVWFHTSWLEPRATFEPTLDLTARNL